MENVKRILEEAFKVDAISGHAWVNLHVEGEILSVFASNTTEEAESQRVLIIDSLTQLLSNA
jgi:hypothetical protein